MPSLTKSLIVAALLATAPAVLWSQSRAPRRSTEARLQALEDRVALKALVDTFSVLADRKAIAEQVLLFTEDATVESIVNGQSGGVLKGRPQLAAAFGGFLAQFSAVYHLNGQQTLSINGDAATGTAYCQVVLIGTQDGKTVKTTMGVIYDDTYVRRGRAWLIATRRSNFTWQTRDELPPAAGR